MHLEKEIRKYLDEICVGLGFCLPSQAIESLATRVSYEVDEFVREIFLAEEVSPDVEVSLFRQLKRKFTDRFGSEVDIHTK